MGVAGDPGRDLRSFRVVQEGDLVVVGGGRDRCDAGGTGNHGNTLDHLHENIVGWVVAVADVVAVANCNGCIRLDPGVQLAAGASIDPGSYCLHSYLVASRVLHNVHRVAHY